MDTLSLTKEARIYNGKKTTSLTSSAGKTGQLLVKEHFIYLLCLFSISLPPLGQNVIEVGICMYLVFFLLFCIGIYVHVSVWLLNISNCILNK